ncbi:MAG: SMC-Scp complex subunit ScpB [Patescibacteria group bacterium]
MTLEAQLEAILFWYAEPVAIKDLVKSLEKTEEEITAALAALESQLSERGISLLQHGGEVSLRTSPKASSLIEKLTKEELSKDLGKAGLETLSVILYQGPISRSEIDYIRGTNSQYIIRNLLIRGLIKKTEDPKDERRMLYEPTLDLLSHLGISSIKDLPERERIQKEIEGYKQAANTEPTTNGNQAA